ncbi:MAG: hypothetical protein O3C10_14155 [Chloroflexi bacterium]|nr:hypothetical protein [Chloroflexota bacterium]
MDRDYGLDIDAIVGHIDSAPTLSFFFPRLRRALIVDMRQGPEDGPYIRVLPMARSLHERLRGLKRARPHLPKATELVAIPWPIYVENMVRSGVWARVMKRIESAGSPDAMSAAESALTELRAIESQELTALIQGGQYETIWAREPG